jgi:hypothetical protein
MTRIMLEALKSILYVYQMLDEIKEKLPPKYAKIYPKKKTIFGLKWPPHSVFSPFSPFTKK